MVDMDNKKYAEEIENERIKNNIPDFSNVFEGQEWFGRSRLANMIKDMKLKPKKAGTHSREAQEKSILQSCAFTDDKENQIATLLEIYEERQPKTRKERTKKYEPYIELMLLYTLANSENGILKTTKSNFFKDINAIPETYKKIPVTYYCEIMPEELSNNNQTEIAYDLNRFHEIAEERFRNIIIPTLESLSQKSVIKYQRYKVIVKWQDKKKKYISMFNDEELGLKKGSLARMMMNAEQYAASQIQVEVFDKEQRKKIKIRLKNIADVMKYYKQTEFKKIFNDYIKKEYGWSYTFERIEIILSDNQKYITEIIEETKQTLNNILNKALKTTIKKKIDNCQEKYENEFLKTKIQYSQNQDIIEMCKNELLVNEDIENKVHMFRYSREFPKRADYFCNHEILFDEDAQKMFIEWINETSKK